jgi:hypothetical protein
MPSFYARVLAGILYNKLNLLSFNYNNFLLIKETTILYASLAALYTKYSKGGVKDKLINLLTLLLTL